MLKRFAQLFLAIVLLALTGYLGVGYVLYNQLSNIEGRCDDKRDNRPDDFRDVKAGWDAFGFDYAAYFMPAYEPVSFPSREADIEISAWYVEADPAGPAVVIVHGLGSCKYAHTVLAPAGMLARNGINALIIDLRDSGDSTYEDGRAAIGNEEYLDALGGWDWLQTAKGIPAERIGLLGNSMGAATALIAFANEPGVPAVFVDSPFDNLPQIIREELERENYPQFLYHGGIWAARLVSGDRLLAYNPYEALENAAGRSLYVIHGTADERISVQHTYQLRERAAALGVDATFWLIDGADHVQAAAVSPATYEERLVAFFETNLR